MKRSLIVLTRFIDLDLVDSFPPLEPPPLLLLPPPPLFFPIKSCKTEYCPHPSSELTVLILLFNR
jgi:hypothetical protein